MLRRLLFVCKTVFSLETYALEESQTLFRMHVCKIISWFVLAEVRAEGAAGLVSSGLGVCVAGQGRPDGSG